jgi:hypothetical protein
MKTQFQVRGYSAFSEEDHYEQGCIGPAKHENEGHALVMYGKTFDELLDLIKIQFSVPDDESFLLDSCGDIGRLDLQVMQREPFDISKLSPQTLQRWKAGKKKLYLTCYTFYVEQVNVELELSTLTERKCFRG